MQLSGLTGRWRRLTRFANGVLGADKYERYLDWHRTTRQSGEPLDRKSFWRHEYHRQEHNPGSRCC
ncbi:MULTISPECIES: YbdD/YjiX family protein [unclassified Luteococcus]|uniref:YbdD/YjiX family protein n=1 Tax=unclassified Luteococcus TaxID=2639923 RepID=UPI00313D1181